MIYANPKYLNKQEVFNRCAQQALYVAQLAATNQIPEPDDGYYNPSTNVYSPTGIFIPPYLIKHSLEQINYRPWEVLAQKGMVADRNRQIIDSIHFYCGYEWSRKWRQLLKHIASQYGLNTAILE